MSRFQEKKERLYCKLQQGGTPAVAFSGGVDSGLLLYLATKLRKGDALGIMAVTEAQSEKEIEKALKFGREHQLNIEVVELNILEDLNVAHNHRDRCYHCKKMILKAIKTVGQSHHCDIIYDGSIADDNQEYRPGAKALAEEGIESPLKEWGFNKTNVRNLACDMELTNWNKPSVPCLLTRFPYDMQEKITKERIHQIEKGEELLSLLCSHNYRLRWEGPEWARIEASKDDMNTILQAREGMMETMERIGFSKVTLDLRPFKSGSYDRE